jgi:hypothetical protein
MRFDSAILTKTTSMKKGKNHRRVKEWSNPARGLRARRRTRDCRNDATTGHVRNLTGGDPSSGASRRVQAFSLYSPFSTPSVHAASHLVYL